MNTFINHVAAYITDLEQLKEYYVKYFNSVSNDKYVADPNRDSGEITS